MTMNSVNDRLADAELDDKYDGLMIGTVVENNDPLGVSRIKVKIPNLLDPDQGPVPWCLPSKHSPFGQGPNYGVYGTPKVGSPVRVSLQGGDPQHPVYEADEYLVANANPKFKDPNTWGFKDPGGSELFVNYQTGAWEFTHQSGTTLKYDGQGNLNLHVAKDRTTDIVGNDTTTIGGDASTTINGNETTTIAEDSTTTIQGAMNLTVSGNAAINVTGNLDVTAGGTTNVTSTGAVNITGSTINLN
jgi:uncharacterized protein involved in type VI secretion and phage assembly